MSRPRVLAAAILIALTPVAMTGCSDDEVRSLGGGPVAGNLNPTAVPTNIVVASGNGQAGLIGNTLVAPIVITVRDIFGNGVAGVPVLFQLTSGRAILGTETGVTDRNGQASSTITIQSAGIISGTVAIVGSKEVPPVSFAATGVTAGTVFAGAGTAAATNAFAALRAAIGGANNGANPPAAPLTTGRREINWDAVVLTGGDFGGQSITITPGETVAIPTNRFQARGVLFDRLTAVGDGFDTENPGVTGQFIPFSPNLSFTPFGINNRVQVNFVRPTAPPTTAAAATVSAFGSIFLDVERANTSSIEYFAGANSLGRFFVPADGSAMPDFLGVRFDQRVVTHVVLTSGEQVLFNFVSPGPATSGAADLTVSGAVDQAVLDDFVYSEPQ